MKYDGKEEALGLPEDMLQSVTFSEDANRNDVDLLLDWVTERPTLLVCPAQNHRAFSAWVKENDVLECLAAEGFKFLKWFVVDGSIDAPNMAIQSISCYGNSIDHVIVKNEGRSTNWDYFNNCRPLQELIQKYTIPVITCPKLADDRRIPMEEKQWTFIEALGPTGFPTKMGKQAVHSYLKKAFKAIEGVGVLG